LAGCSNEEMLFAMLDDSPITEIFYFRFGRNIRDPRAQTINILDNHFYSFMRNISRKLYIYIYKILRSYRKWRTAAAFVGIMHKRIYSEYMSIIKTILYRVDVFCLF